MSFGFFARGQISRLFCYTAPAHYRLSETARLFYALSFETANYKRSYLFYMNTDNDFAIPLTRGRKGDEQENENTSDTLEDVARDEQEFLHERLRRELKREPSEEEINEYVRQHTEGY